MRLKPKQPRGGFTLIEMAVVVLIISVLIAIAWPNWETARERGRIRTCLANLSSIRSAKEHYISEKSPCDGDAVSFSDLVPTYMRTQPSCPANGRYEIEAVGTDPTCDFRNHELQ